MKILSILDDKIANNVEYYYTRRDSAIRYNPDLTPEFFDKERYTKKDGNLFYGKTVAWRDQNLLDGGIDLNIDIDEVAFLDSLTIEQKGSSEIQSIEVFERNGKKYRKIAFLNGETGKNITNKHLTIRIGTYADKITVRFNGKYKNIVINKIDLKGVFKIKNSIWPIPEVEEVSDEKYPLSLLGTIEAKNEDEMFSANYFAEKLKEKTGKDIRIVSNCGNIALATLQSKDNDAFSLQSTKGKVTVSGTGRRGLLFALDALLQLIENDEVKCCNIANEDFMGLRGVHIALPDKKEIPFVKNLVKYVLIPNHYNMIFLQIAGAMNYKNFPEINKEWVRINAEYRKGNMPKPPHYDFVTADKWERSEVRSLCDFFESYGLEVVPEIQTFGHSQYITCAYPDLAEKIKVVDESDVDVNVKDIMPSTVYKSCLCPNHEDYYKIVFGIIDEVIEVVKPKRFVHLGHDEIYNIGKCSVCSHLTRDEIFAKEVTELDKHIKSKNLTMMIWADMIQDMDYSATRAIDNIPKDIVMLDFVWYFYPEKDIEDRLLEHGFQVVMGNMYSSHYTRYESRSKKKNILGAEVSTWVKCSEKSYAFEGKMFDFAYSSLGICNKNYKPEMRLSYYEVFKPFIIEARKRIGGLFVDGDEKTLNFDKTQTTYVPNEIIGCTDYSEMLSLDRTATEKTVEVSDFAKVIEFVHATDKAGERVMWQDPFKVAEYTLVYDDGTEFCEEINYGQNIYKLLSPFGDRISSFMFRHEGYIGTYLQTPECGKTYNGMDFTIGHYEIKNPNPEKKIKNIRLKRTADGVNILLFKIKIK